MAAKIRDLVEIVPTPNSTSDRDASPAAALASLLLTYDVGDVLTRIVARCADPGDDTHNSLVVGGSGSGKSTLIRAAANILASPPGAEMPHQRLAEIRASIGTIEFYVVAVPRPDGAGSLQNAIESAVLARASREGWLFAERPSAEGQLEALERVVAALRPEQRLLVTVDDLDEWLRGAGRFAFENLQTLVYLGGLARIMPVVTVAGAGGGMLLDDASAPDGRGWMASLHEDFHIEYIPSHVVRIATASKVLRKSARQRREILEVLGALREKLPELEYTDQEFVDLYPLEASTWTVGSHLHRWDDSFSFPDFAARAAESVRNRPAMSLFTLNDMFGFCEPQLRRVDALQPLFAVYDRLTAEAVPMLGQSQKLWATFALQSLLMHALAGMTVDVVTLTNSVLVYSLHGTTSSYAFMAAVLKQLEAISAGEIVANGDGTARRYSLVTGQREAAEARIEAEADALEDGDEVAWALLGFGDRTFADWPMGLTRPVGSSNTVWEVSHDEGAVALSPRGGGGVRPRLVILAPGRPWSAAREIVDAATPTACWIGAAPTPAGLQTLKKWIAVMRLTSDVRYGRLAELRTLRGELEREAAEVFYRVYVERGTLVTPERSERVEALVTSERDDNLVSAFLPAATPADETAASERLEPNEARWLATLTAPTPDDVEDLATERSPVAWRKRLEVWYANGVRRGLTVPPNHGDEGAAGEALEAKQQFDVALFSVRRALNAGSLEGLGGEIELIFESPEALWATRERLDWLEGYLGWLETIDSARRYLSETEPVDDAEIEAVRQHLVEWIDTPGAFVDDRRRSAFGDAFNAFREEYGAVYADEHERAVSPQVIDRLCRAIVESHPWRALETLSSLPIGDPSRLVEATNVLSQLREARCDADVRAALAEWPRCGCGFRFGDRTRLASLAQGAAEHVQAGIDQHRAQLQSRRSELRAKLKARKDSVDPETIKTIAVLTGPNELPEIDAVTAAALADLLATRPA